MQKWYTNTLLLGIYKGGKWQQVWLRKYIHRIIVCSFFGFFMVALKKAGLVEDLSGKTKYN